MTFRNFHDLDVKILSSGAACCSSNNIATLAAIRHRHAILGFDSTFERINQSRDTVPSVDTEIESLHTPANHERRWTQVTAVREIMPNRSPTAYISTESAQSNIPLSQSFRRPGGLQLKRCNALCPTLAYSTSMNTLLGVQCLNICLTTVTIHTCVSWGPMPGHYMLQLSIC